MTTMPHPHPAAPAALTLLILTTVASPPCAAAAPDPRVREQVLRPDDRAINARGERQTNMEAVEAARDRGAGRIVDDGETWALDRIDAAAGDRHFVPGRTFQLLDSERDRQLRIEAHDRLRAVRAARAGRDAWEADLGIVPPDAAAPGGRGGGAGLSPLTSQLYEDDRTLARAADGLRRLLDQLDEAESRELRALRGRLEREGRAGEFDAPAEKIRAEYGTWRRQAREEHDRLRRRVTGDPVAPGPATQPSSGDGRT